VVGAGALGCEWLKVLALSGAATAEGKRALLLIDGSLVVVVEEEEEEVVEVVEIVVVAARLTASGSRCLLCRARRRIRPEVSEHYY